MPACPEEIFGSALEQLLLKLWEGRGLTAANQVAKLLAPKSFIHLKKKEKH
jgi:hypothetical protein